MSKPARRRITLRGRGSEPQTPPPPSGPRYEPSSKHCEPITAAKPGSKCPQWSVAIAQDLLDASVPMGDKRVATRNGVAFVAQITNAGVDVWHGYPEAWDRIDAQIKRDWLAKGLVTRRELRQWRTESAVKRAWREGG